MIVATLVYDKFEDEGRLSLEGVCVELPIPGKPFSLFYDWHGRNLEIVTDVVWNVKALGDVLLVQTGSEVLELWFTGAETPNHSKMLRLVGKIN